MTCLACFFSSLPLYTQDPPPPPAFPAENSPMKRFSLDVDQLIPLKTTATPYTVH